MGRWLGWRRFKSERSSQERLCVKANFFVIIDIPLSRHITSPSCWVVFDLPYNFSTSRQRPNRAPATGLSNRFSPLTPCRAYSHLRWNGQFLPPIVVFPSRLPAPTSHGPSPSDIPLLPQNSARPIRELPKISQFGCQLPNHTAPFLRCRNFPAVGACWLGPLN